MMGKDKQHPSEHIHNVDGICMACAYWVWREVLGYMMQRVDNTMMLRHANKRVDELRLLLEKQGFTIPNPKRKRK
jgi:hypothetical protein